MQMHSSLMFCLVIFTIPGDDTRRPRQSKNAPPEPGYSARFLCFKAYFVYIFVPKTLKCCV